VTEKKHHVQRREKGPVAIIHKRTGKAISGTTDIIGEKRQGEEMWSLISNFDLTTRGGRVNFFETHEQRRETQSTETVGTAGAFLGD